MTRAALVAFGWLFAAATLYLVLLLLELYWNLFQWDPKWDARTVGMLGLVSGVVVLTAFLARGSQHPFTRVLSGLLSAALLSLGFYVLPAEALTEGLFARTAPSPFWYRGTRCVVMGLPLLFWLLAFRRSNTSDRLARSDVTNDPALTS